MDFLSIFSERLKDLMDEAELNISALAERTGLSASVISRILARERMPAYKTFIKLADVFNCSADYLVGKVEIWSDQTFKPCPPFKEQFDFLLKYFKISKYKLEKDTGLKEDTVNRWHNGKYDPTIEHILKLANYFKCSVDFILGREI